MELIEKFQNADGDSPLTQIPYDLEDPLAFESTPNLPDPEE